MKYSQTQAGQDLEATLVNQSFASLTAIKTAWKTSVTGDLEAWAGEYKRNLLAALKEYQINTVEMIELGLRNARAESSPFLPSPGQFCEWCKVTPEDLGLPNEAEAFREARQEAGRWCQARRWSHEAIWLAASQTGFFELKSVSEKDSGYRDLRGIFLGKYRAIVKRALNGEVLSIPPENRIERVKSTHDSAASKKAGDKVMSSIMGMLNE